MYYTDFYPGTLTNFEYERLDDLPIFFLNRQLQAESLKVVECLGLQKDPSQRDASESDYVESTWAILWRIQDVFVMEFRLDRWLKSLLEVEFN